MAERSHTLILLRQLSLLLGLVIIAFLLSNITESQQGYLLHLVQVAKTGLVLLITKVFHTILLQKITFHYHKLYKKQPPHFMLRIVQATVFFLMLLTIIVFVFNESVFSIMALSGVVGAGIALGIGPIILDAFSGLAHESENGFEVGDWLQIDDRFSGKVKSISWRVVILETQERTTIVIPQRKLSDGYINLSRPSKSLIQTLEITLDHNIPIGRAERLLTGAGALAQGVHNKTCGAWAIKTTAGGIVYEVRYLIEDYAYYQEIRHSVLEAITRQLHDYGLKHSGTVGEYALLRGGKPFEEYSPLAPEHILSKVSLFAALPKTAFAALCHSAKQQAYSSGSYIVQQGDAGDSLFVIAEGITEVLLKQDNKKITSVAHLTVGDHFGEMSLLTGNHRSATVRATTNCVVFEISKNAIAPILQKDPNIVKVLAREIEEKNKINMMKEKQTQHKSQHQESEIIHLIKAIKGYFDL